MIKITCTSCQALLSMDDAFAGGVCRCQHCGAIQTVPRRHNQATARSRARPATVGAITGARNQGADDAESGPERREAAEPSLPPSRLPADSQPPLAAAEQRGRTRFVSLLIVLILLLLAGAGAVVWLAYFRS
jgi:hypothetical protein